MLRYTTLLALLLLLTCAGLASAQPLDDGGFETLRTGDAWSAFSSRFGTPICDRQRCGQSAGIGPQDGQRWAWFGGVEGYEEAYLEQTVRLTAGAPLRLEFWVENPAASGNGRDYLRVQLDGVELFRLTEGDPEYRSPRRVSLDLSSFADGGLHTLRFHGEIFGRPGQPHSDFFLDGVELASVAEGVPAPIFSDGFETADTSRWFFTWGATCNIDTDVDRLGDCFETNTGVYVSELDTGTDPNNADTDGDSIIDGDEVRKVAGLDLAGMGANPLKKNIFLEYDWFDDNLDPGTCAAHSHRPTAAAVAMVEAAFAAAPVSNPDGTTGIAVIQDYGQGGLFTGGNLIADPNGVIAGGVNGAEFQAHKTANFAANRQGYFHYTLLPHRYNTTSGSSGQAELPGNDLVVSLYCFGSDTNVSHTILHELGHNLNLRHGGHENCNWKPNYNSVMNYRYQFPGIDNNCSPPGDGVLDYSIGDRIDLVESDLDENAGTCGATAWDWNGNTIIESSVSFNINPEETSQAVTCGGTMTTLRDHDDWGNIFFGGIGDGDGAAVLQEIIDCTNPPPPAPPARLQHRQVSLSGS